MEKIRLTRFKDGKKKALTMSYDDGYRADIRLIDIFNKNGIKGTFHLNSGYLNDPKKVHADELSEIYRGHEVAIHTVTHPFLERVSTEEVVYEVVEDRRALEATVGYPVCGMSYPQGTYSEKLAEQLRALGVKYSRTVKGTLKFDPPENFLIWHPTIHHNKPELFDLLKRFKAEGEPRLSIFYVWGHSYEFDRQDNWDLIERFCAEAGGDENVWYATNMEIYEYITALRALTFTVDRKKVYNPTATDVWIEVDDEPVHVPAGKLTIIEE